MNKFKAPPVGKRVTVETDWSQHRNTLDTVPRLMGAIRQYVGTVIPNDSHLGADVFMLQTNNPHFPISVISLSMVTNITFEDGRAGKKLETKFPEIKGRTWLVQGSKPGTMYTVSFQEGHWTCTCPGFQFRVNCKHVTNKINETKGQL